jgi:sterol desaturase/sphingolipid hydroxylase (fatty acid hydroxylase superfamily)
MERLLVANPALLHGFILIATILAVAAWEMRAPRRALTAALAPRWVSNFGLALVNSFTVYRIFPLFGFGLALLAESRGWGLFNAVALPLGIPVLGSLLLLDLGHYGRHRVFHAVPLFWSVHRVHHADADVDLTTSLRFHPLEALGFGAFDLALVLALGAPPIAVLLYHALNVGVGLIQHANARLPQRADRILRAFLVTPDFHRVHHSTQVAEANSNFAALLPWWDFLFGTYRAQPEAGHEEMAIGLSEYTQPERLSLVRLLADPFWPARDVHAPVAEASR